VNWVVSMEEIDKIAYMNDANVNVQFIMYRFPNESRYRAQTLEKMCIFVPCGLQHKFGWYLCLRREIDNTLILKVCNINQDYRNKIIVQKLQIRKRFTKYK